MSAASLLVGLKQQQTSGLPGSGGSGWATTTRAPGSRRSGLPKAEAKPTNQRILTRRDWRRQLVIFIRGVDTRKMPGPHQSMGVSTR